MSTPMISKLGNTGRSLVTASSKTPGQQEIFEQLKGGAQPGIGNALNQISGLAGGGSPELWQQLEAPALRQFGQLQGSIASRFSGLGTGGRRSSGFQNTLGGAATDLAERLQSQRLGLQQGAQKQLLDLYQMLLGEDMQDTWSIENKRKNPWGGALSGAASGALAGSLFGPIGTGVGAAGGGLAGYFAGR